MTYAYSLATAPPPVVILETESTITAFIGGDLVLHGEVDYTADTKTYNFYRVQGDLDYYLNSNYLQVALDHIAEEFLGADATFTIEYFIALPMIADIEVEITMLTDDKND